MYLCSREAVGMNCFIPTKNFPLRVPAERKEILRTIWREATAGSIPLPEAITKIITIMVIILVKCAL